VDTIADVVEELTSAQASGFDVKDKRAEKIAQRAIKSLAAASHWIKAELELGPTVAGQAGYTLADKIVRLFDVVVGENTPYGRRDIRILWDLRAGRTTLSGEEGGVFAERFDATGTKKTFDIYPTPEEVLPILGLASITPDDLAAGETLPFPEQYRGAILDFARVELYEQSDENKALAESYEKRALSKAEGLFLLANARTGSGPWKIPVAGHRRR
jgi:hypothetical protein